MRRHRLQATIAASASALVLLAVSGAMAARTPEGRQGLSKATPKKQQPQPTPTPTPTPPGALQGQPTGGPKAAVGPATAQVIGPPVQTILQLLQHATPNVIVFFPFDSETYDQSNPTVPLDIIGRHPVYNGGGYMQLGRLRQSLRFGPFAPMFLTALPAANAINLDVGPFCTISAWVLPERLGGLTGSGNATIVCRGVTTLENTASFCLALSPQGVPTFEGRVPGNLPNAGPWTLQATRSLIPGRWQHVCAVFDRGAVSFFIDGQPAGQSRAPATFLDPVRLVQSPLYIATRFVRDQGSEIRDPYFGYLDDVALWNRPLRFDEIAVLARDADANGIADYWDFLITGAVPGGVTVTPTPASAARTPSPYRSRKTPTPTPTPPGFTPPAPTPTPVQTPRRVATPTPEKTPRRARGPFITPTPTRTPTPMRTPTPTPPPRFRSTPPPRSPTPTASATSGRPSRRRSAR